MQFGCIINERTVFVMYRGKKRCRILKQIRQKIANENDIPYVTSECKHKGDCAGTCPKCESELRYLEDELRKRRALGAKVSVAGVALAVSLSTTACSELDIFNKGNNVEGAVPAVDETLDGDVAYPEDDIEVGEFPEDTEQNDNTDNVTNESVITGDMPIYYDELAGVPMP